MFLNPLVLLLVVCGCLGAALGAYELAAGVAASLGSLLLGLLFLRHLSSASHRDFLEDHPKLESLFRDEQRAREKQTFGLLGSQLQQLAINLVVGAYSTVTLFTLIGICRQQPNLDLIHGALLMTVILVPEGLPLALEVILTFSLLRINHARASLNCTRSLEVLAYLRVIVIKVEDVNHAIDQQLKASLDRLHDQFKIEIKILTDSPLCLESVINSSTLGTVEPSVISGLSLNGLFNSKTELLLRVDDIETNSIFYSLNPARKANLVSKLQQLNKVVAVVGRGPCDAYCMEQADFSLALNVKAPQLAGYRVAEMVSLDADLECLFEAIAESRGVFCKLRGFVCYQASTSISLLLLLGLSAAINLDTPFSTSQLLFMNLLTDGLSAQILCAEKVEPEVLANKEARRFDESILDWRSVLVLIGLTSTLFLVNGGLYYLQLDETGALKRRANILIFTCYIISTALAAIALRLNCLRRVLSH